MNFKVLLLLDGGLSKFRLGMVEVGGGGGGGGGGGVSVPLRVEQETVLFRPGNKSWKIKVSTMYG
jgi:hypothetical protein